MTTAQVGAFTAALQGDSGAAGSKESSGESMQTDTEVATQSGGAKTQVKKQSRRPIRRGGKGKKSQKHAEQQRDAPDTKDGLSEPTATLGSDMPDTDDGWSD